MKTVIKRLKVITWVLVLAVGFTACEKKENPTPIPAADQFFSISIWGEDEQYIAPVPSITEGALSFVGNGIEAESSRYLWHKQYIYLMNITEKKFFQYEMKADGTLTEKAYILTDGVVPNYFQSLTVVDDNTLLVLGTVDDNNGVGGWARISISDFRVIDRGTLTVPYDAANPGLLFYIGKGFVDNGKFILGGYFYDYVSDSYAADGVKALVYDYPAMNNMKVISSDLADGCVGYDYLHSLDKDEDGHHYFVVSSGKYWGGVGGKSGIVRIKKGQASFDPDYFFDVTTPVGKDACLMGMNYVGNGIAFGTVQYEEMMTSIRDRYKNIAQVVKLDLKNKSVTVMNSPLSPVGMVRHPLVFNNKYYTGITPVGEEAHIYEFDPAGDANAFKKGIALDGGGYVQVQLIAPHPVQ